MNCYTCNEKLTDETHACPYCGSVLHLFDGPVFDKDLDDEDFDRINKRMHRQRKILIVIIWLALIAFITWIVLRILSGIPNPGIPDFGEMEFF